MLCSRSWRYSRSIVSSPSPSMFIALRLTKCSILPFICGGQTASFGHRQAASPSTRTNGVPHSGQTSGKEYIIPSLSDAVSLISSFRSARPTIFGMISPPFSTHTRSPGRISSERMKSSLWSVALWTIVPDSCMGSRFATGVTTPVRPTWYVISRNNVNCFSAGNL